MSHAVAVNPPTDLNQALGFVRVVELDPAGRATIEYQAGMHMCHSGGVVQGGFVTGWIDAAMAYAASISRPLGVEVSPGAEVVSAPETEPSQEDGLGA